jgi:hypothetical protein
VSVIIMTDNIFEKCVPYAGWFVVNFGSEFLNNCPVSTFYNTVGLWSVWRRKDMFDLILKAKVFKSV